MKHVVLVGILLFGCDVSLLQAGSILSLLDRPEVDGKLILSTSGIHADGASQADVNLSDVLEADFGETPFQLNFYFSANDKGGKLPAGWVSQDIGPVPNPGSVEDTNGTMTVMGSGNLPKKGGGAGDRSSDTLFFAGSLWAGNSVWTAHLAKIGTGAWETSAGLMMRESLAPPSVMIAVGATSGGNGGVGFRPETGKNAQFTPIPMDLPVWMRITRYGSTILTSISTDGKEWELLAESGIKTLSTPTVGLFVDSRREKDLGKASFDQISFTPTPSLSQILPPGVVLQSGSFLAGSFERLNTDPANADAQGIFRSGGRPVSIPRSKIAAVLMLPTTRAQITDMSSHVGLLMKNGDIMDGDFDSIQGGRVEVNSVLLGITAYDQSEVRGCFLHPVQKPTANYQLRLRNGSIVNASALEMNNGLMVIQEASGISIPVALEDVAQFRAGPAVAQSLAELDWKATPPGAPAPANAPPPSMVPGPAPAPAAAASTNAPPAANPVPDDSPPVLTWQGPDQEQILQAGIGTTIDFPLPGRYRALGVKIAMTSDSPPNSQLTVRVLADGREIGRTPPFKAGDQPRFMQVNLQDPKTVTLEADSIYTGAKVLFIDPVAIRDN